MIKAKFVGETDDFFENGEEYTILGSYITEYGKPQIIVRFSRLFPLKAETLFGEPIEQCLCGAYLCPHCHRHLPKVEVESTLLKGRTRSVPYGSLDEFLENWEIIHD